MTLTLTVQGGGDAAPRTIEIEDAATLGRAPDCTLVLDDAKRGVSRVQARIERRDDAYVLFDEGSNPTLLNDEPLDGSRETMLADRDRIRIGVYTLVVGLEAPAAVDHTLMTQPAPQVRPNAPSLPETPEFEALPPAPLIPDDWNATHHARPDAKQEEPLDARFTPDPLAGAPLLREPGHLGGEGNQALMDALGAGDPLRDGGARAGRDSPALSRSFEHVSPERAMSVLPQEPSQNQSQEGGAHEPMPRLTLEEAWAVSSSPTQSIAQPSRASKGDSVAVAMRAPRRKESPSPSTSEPSDEAQLLDALLAGLGIERAEVSHVPAAQLAHLIGSMLREATQGAMSVLRSRALTKRESRMAMTMIEERDNNPLKFFPDADRALTQMLGSRGRGYLDAEEALRAAFRDIQAHELALIAGMRAALDDAMARIDPAVIERSLDAPSRFDAIVGNHRARLWRRYVKTWEQVSRDAGDDFQQRFGEPFGRAYQAQLDALQTPKD
jgi:type VI secretion system protein